MTQLMRDIVLSAVKKSDRAAFADELHQWYAPETNLNSFSSAAAALAVEGAVKCGRALPAKKTGLVHKRRQLYWLTKAQREAFPDEVLPYEIHQFARTKAKQGKNPPVPTTQVTMLFTLQVAEKEALTVTYQDAKSIWEQLNPIFSEGGR